MAKRGRPKQDPADNVSAVVTARMTQAECRACERAAERAGLKLSSWARKALLQTAKRAIR